MEKILITGSLGYIGSVLNTTSGRAQLQLYGGEIQNKKYRRTGIFYRLSMMPMFKKEKKTLSAMIFTKEQTTYQVTIT